MQCLCVQITSFGTFNSFKTNPPCPPSNQLLNIVKASLDKSNSETVKPATEDYKSLSHLDLLGGCIDSI